MKLIDRIEEYLKSVHGSVSTWEIANELYDNCMQKSQHGNGIKIANIKMACHKSKNICNFLVDEASYHRWAGEISELSEV